MSDLKRLVCVAREQLEWRSYSEPELSPGELRVRSDYSASKHGTEMAAFKGYEQSRGKYDPSMKLFDGEAIPDFYPVSVGNMFVGHVSEKHSDVAQFKLGDVVFGHGGFSSTHTVTAASCRELPDGMSWQSAVCIDPAEFALSAIRDAQLRVGDNVAVFGLGAIGLMVLQFARLAGVKTVIGVEPLQRRREIAGKIGVDELIDPAKTDAGAEIKRITGNRGADACIEYSGSRAGLYHAIRGVAFGGIVAAGAYPRPYDEGLDFGAEAHMNRPNLVFTRACSDPGRDHPRWDDRRIIDTCFEMFADGKISGDMIVTPIVPFDEILNEYERIPEDPNSYIKLGAKH